MTSDPRIGRRRLFHTGAAALGGLAVSGATVATASATEHPSTPPTSPAAELARSVDFYGPHQAGIDLTPQSHAVLLGLDLIRPRAIADLRRLMRLLSDDAARLTQGRAALADTEPELATDPARLTVTFGFSPRVMRLLGVTDAVDSLPPFGVDRLRRQWAQSDVLVQLRADDPIVLSHARRVITKDSRTLAKLTWTQDGFRGGPVTPAGTGRNLMGQVDGTINPAFHSDDFERLVWRNDGPHGVAGGTCLVVRRISMQLDKWDKVDRVGREFVIGRTLDTGAPLTGQLELDPIDFEATDAHGFPVIDAAAHVRVAHHTNSDERFLRAPYNYVTQDGEDSGLLFLAYAGDLQRQFVPVMRRVAESDRLNAWVTPIGSAVYFLPPGCSEGSFVGAPLIGDK